MALKDIPGYEKYYAASDDGQIWSKRSNRFLKTYLNRCGYLTATLSVARNVKTFYVHRLVALAWLPNPDNLPQVDHINMNPLDNRVENLEWVSRAENMQRVANSGARTDHMREMEKARHTNCNTYKIYKDGQLVHKTHSATKGAAFVGVGMYTFYIAYTTPGFVTKGGYTVVKEVNEYAKEGFKYFNRQTETVLRGVCG